MLRRLFTRSAHVKPVGDYWATTYGTPLEEFADDWLRYGLRVAWYNLKVMVRDDHAKSV